MKNKLIALLCAAAMSVGVLAGCGNAANNQASTPAGTETATESATEAVTADSTLIYGSNDYTRINPAIDEHGEINH